MTDPTPQDPDAFLQAVVTAKDALAEGKTKVQAVRAMYPFIANETKEVIQDAFVRGADLTPKGAVTYLYNIKRELSKGKKAK